MNDKRCHVEGCGLPPVTDDNTLCKFHALKKQREGQPSVVLQTNKKTGDKHFVRTESRKAL
jgi:hypothetical protein